MDGQTGSQVDFTQGIYRELARPLMGGTLCAYQIALAAWQRGLRVEYFGSQAAARVSVPAMKKTTEVAQFLVVDDGKRRHAFERSRGDLSDKAAVDLAQDKAGTKRALAAAGVLTPAGLAYSRRGGADVEAFLKRSKATQFVLKPNAGSLSIGVVTRLAKGQVLPLLATATYDSAVLEEFITGTEYRVHAVGDRAVHGYVKSGVFVVGNGFQTLAQLIQAKNQRRAEIPGYEISPIDPSRAVQLLRLTGRDLTHVPVMGEKVFLSEIGNISMGGEAVGQTELPEAVVQASVAAIKAVGLPNGGVDIIFDGTRAWVLEVNASAFLRAHAFVTGGFSAGNAVAEAIVDHHFPAESLSRRNEALDPAPILAEFAAKGVAGHHRLPPLPAP